MQLIIDANILFSLLIKDGKTQEIFLYPGLDLFAPGYILEEFEKHKSEILSKTKRTANDFENILSIIKQIIKIIPKFQFENLINKACKISPDPDDVMYFALALKLNCPIWSNDKKLKQQNIVKVFSTEDINSILE